MPAMRIAVVLAVLGLSLLPSAQAAKADRARPLIVDAGDGAIVGDKTPGRYEVQGPVLVTKGSLQMRANRLVATVRERGYLVEAQAEAGGAVQFAMDLDQPGTRMEARADRIEYEEDTGLLRLLGNARLRQLAGGQMQRELTGNLIVFDTLKEAVLADGKPLATQKGDGGVRVILMPPPGAASDAAPTAPVQLQTAPALTPKPPPK